MKVQLGSGHDDIIIPENNLQGILLPPSVDKLADQSDYKIMDSLIEEDKYFSLDKFLADIKNSENGDLLIIMNDANRPTPSFVILEQLMWVVSDFNKVCVSIATGSHSPPNENEIQSLLGNSYDTFKDLLHIHRAREKDQHRYYGRTSRGTEVFLDKILDNYNNVLVIGSVEPHYFAGYTGGRKAFLPGLSFFNTIENNHSFSLDPEAKLLKLDSNPVHLDMMEACGLIENKRIYSIQLVLGGDGMIRKAFGGSLENSFLSAVPECKRLNSIMISQKSDIMVAVAEYPLDISLYQSQKALENSKRALKDGGTMIFVSKTRKGIGDPVFYDLLSSSNDLDSIENHISNNYKLGYQKTAKFIEAIKRFKIMLVTTLEPSVVKKIHMRPLDSVQDALDLSIQEEGPDSKVLIMPMATALVPSLE